MRKKFRKITATVLIVAMAFSVTMPVFADSQPEEINGEWRVTSYIIHKGFPMAWTDRCDDIQTDFSLAKE